MKFAEALEAASEVPICRESWGHIDFVVLMPELQLPPYNTQGTDRKVNDRTAKWIGEDKPLNCRPYFASYREWDNAWQPGWVPTQEDILADDWAIYSL